MPGGGDGPRDDAPGTPLEARLIRPGRAPLHGRLVHPPRAIGGGAIARGIGAALRSPFLVLGFAGAAFLGRAGWLLGAALLVFGGGWEVALVIGGTASLAGGLVELAVFAGGVRVLARKIKGDEPTGGAGWLETFSAGLSTSFAAMVAVGLLHVAAWLLLQLLVVCMGVATVLVALREPQAALFLLPIWLLLFAADGFFRLLLSVAIARIGALEESSLVSIANGLAQFARRPIPHLLLWLGSGLALASTVGGTYLFFLGLAGEGFLPGRILFLVFSLLAFSLVWLATLGAFTSLALADEERPR